MIHCTCIPEHVTCIMATSVAVVGISGASNSGKTCLTKKLVEHFKNSKVIHQDEYFLDLNDPRLTYIPDLKHHDWDDISALDMKKFTADTLKIIQDLNSSISVPSYAYSGDSQDLNSPILFVEGFLLYTYPSLNKLFNKKFFIQVPKELSEERRRQRVYIPADVPGYFESIVWPKYEMYLKQIKEQNDIEIVDGTNSEMSLFSEVLKNLTNWLHHRKI